MSIELSDEQVKEYIKAVQEHAKARMAECGTDDIPAFLMGAAILLDLSNNWDKLPAKWIFGSMRGDFKWLE